MKIVYEDAYLLCIEKEIGELSQRDKKNSDNIFDAMIAYLKHSYHIKKPYLAMHQRLDRGVGGLILFSKTQFSNRFFMSHPIIKRYTAVVHGKLDVALQSITNYIVKNEKMNRSRICDEKVKGSKLARLEYQKIDEKILGKNIFTKIEVCLDTGRHHQIRVQLANLSHPIVGDIKYGSSCTDTLLPIALHNHEIAFSHPKTLQTMVLTSDPLQNKTMLKYEKNDEIHCRQNILFDVSY